ncbi:unnamed protein product [Symbiodinium sp. CCMP2592]|nr:unnamed protein product [Symbiodinium sp. CCMP2592]
MILTSLYSNMYWVIAATAAQLADRQEEDAMLWTLAAWQPYVASVVTWSWGAARTLFVTSTWTTTGTTAARHSAVDYSLFLRLTMPNHGGRRRRSNEWEERRQAGSGRRYGNAMWQDFHMKRGEAYTHRLTEEEVYNREPEFHKVPMALLGRTYETPRMPPHFNHMPMQNGIGWGGFIPPPAPVVDHVQLVLHNIFLLQCMGPVQAELILKKTAALQGPYTD